MKDIIIYKLYINIISNKRKICSLGIKNEYLNNSTHKQQNPLRDSNSGGTDYKPDTSSTRLWSKLHVAVDHFFF